MRSLALLLVCLSGCGLVHHDPPSGQGSDGGGGGSAGGAGDAGAIYNADPHVQHCLQMLNQYRSQAGVPALALSDRLSAFAMVGSQQLHDGGPAHGHFKQASDSGTLFSQGFCSFAAENQAPGWAIKNGDVDGTIDAILAAMMAEGPGGGHHDNILNTSERLVGVGLVIDGDRLWFTNDFSAACR